jgi:hypothetical protein
MATNRCTEANSLVDGKGTALVASSTIPASRLRAGAQITCAMLQSDKG